MNNNHIYRSFLSLNPIPSFVYDIGTFKIMDVNSKAIEHYGYTKEEFLKITLKDLTPTQEVPKFISSQTDIKNHQRNINFGVFIHQKKNGNLIKMEIHGHKVDLDDCPCMLVVCLDVTKKIEQEEQIRLSEQRFKALMQEGADMINIINTKGKYSFASPNTTAILGITPEEFEGRSIFDFIHPDDIDRVSVYLQQISTESRLILEPFRIRDGKNEWRWIETVMTNMMDNPSVKGIVANSKDITRKMGQNENFEQIKKRFKSLVDNSMDCTIIISAEGNTSYVSGSVTNILGYTPTEAMNIDFKDLIHPEDLAGAKNALALAFKHPGVPMKGYTSRVRHKNGSWRWIEPVITNLLHDSSVNGIVDNFRDITEQVEEQHKLKLLESVITNTKDAVLITEAEPFDDPGPRIIYVNDAFTKMTGYEASEVIGKTPRIFQGPNSDQAELKRLSKALRNWESCEITTINYKKNGEEFWINFTVSPVADETGWYTHWIAIARDVTESKRIEVKLINAKEMAEENEHKMKEAQKLAHLGSWYYDVVNQVSQWSEETYNIWGLNPDNTSVDFVDHEKLVHPKDWERFKAVIKNAIEKGIPYKMELELVCPDGTYKTVNTIGAPIFDENNKVIAFKGTTQDISSRIIIENELRTAKEKAEKSQYAMSQASNLAKIGYWDHDFASNTLTWSDYIYRLYNLTPEDPVLTYQEAKNYFDRPSQEKITIATKELIEKGNSYDLELRMINSNNEEIFLRKVIHPVYNNKKEIIGERGVLQNITDGKYLQELNRDVARMVKIGSWSLDLEKQTVFWSEQIHQIHETDPKSYVPNLKTAINFYRADFRELVQSCVEKAIATGQGYDFEAVIVTANKNEVWIRSIGNAEFVSGKCTRLYGGFQDINIRKQAEEEKIRFQKTLENSLNEIYIFDSKTLNFSYVNKGAIQNLGYTQQELKTLTPIDLKPEFSVTSFRQLVGPLERQEKDKVIFFTHHKRKDGSLYPIEVHMKYVEEYNHKNFIAIILDISERKKAEENLLSTSERLRLATYSAKMGIWDWDVVNNKLIWDDRMYELYKVDKEDFKGAVSAWQNGLHPDDVEQANKDINDALTGKRDFNSVFRIIWPDTSIRYIEGNAIVSRDKEGNAVRMIGANIDITERIKAEEENRFKANLLSTIGQAAIATNLDGIVNYWNRAAENIYGWKQEEAIGKDILLLTPSNANKINAIRIMEMLKKGQPWSGQFDVRKKDGTYFTAHVTNSPIYDQNNRLTGIIGISSDISQEVKNKELLRQYTRKLERTNEELESFAFIASHDLQEPLRMITSFMDQLKRKYGSQLDKKAHQYIHFATDGAKRMKQIILDLLDYSRAGKPTESMEDVNLYQILSEFKLLRRKTISEKSVTISISDLPTIYSYRVEITQIFHSLLDNAIKYAKEGIAPHLEINATENKEEWKIAIKDNGIGIDSKFYDKIFIIFQRLHNRNEFDGTGIGLSIAKKHVEFLGGKIWLESTLGEGSTFYFTLPKSVKV